MEPLQPDVALPPEEAVDERVGPDDWPAAIADTDGPQLVVAGPGTGKTEFIVRRAVELIASGKVDRADAVLVLTFSRRAASDLRRRISAAVGRGVNQIAASTFHSFAYRLVEASLAPGAEPPSLLTGPEQVSLVAELLREEDGKRWPLTLRGLLGSPTLAADLADFLLRCAERLIGPEELEARAAERPEWRAIPAFYRRYLSELARRGRIDYGTVLTRAVAAAADDTAGEIERRHPYVLVDEYQDTSPAQAELLDLATRKHRNITVAGDPYQSVYSFRGAELGNIATFPIRFRSLDGRRGRRLVLTTSFRVPQEILDAALRVTTSGRLPGAAGPVVPAPHPGKVEAHVFEQASAEAEWIAEEVERLHLLEGLRLAEMAVLVRTKRHLLPELSRALGRRGIRHDKPDARLVDHPTVRVVFDLAKAAALPGDAPELDLVMRRLLLGPLFQLGVARQRELARLRRAGGVGWAQVLSTQLGAEGEALAQLLAAPSWASERPAIDGFWRVWESLPQLEALVHDPGAGDARSALATLAQVLERQAERDERVSLLEYWEMTEAEDFEATPLLGYDPHGEDRLVLTTLHQAKGLEFEVVFIADASEGSFPDLRRGVSLLATHALSPAATPLEQTRFRLQEEMRLAYTATTRARRRVVWTATSAGLDESERRPSRFLLAVAGVSSTDELTRPGQHEGPPVTLREVETRLRQALVDPAVPAARRLAAAAVLSQDRGWRSDRFAGLRSHGPDSGVLGPSFTLSPSQAQAFAACPRNYVFERRLGIGDVTSPSASLGSLVHAALEVAEGAAAARGARHAEPGEALAALEQVWAKADFGSEALSRRWRSKAEEAIAWLYENWPEDSGGIVALEHELELEVAGRRWRGRADRVERTSRGTLRVVDYKTSTSPTTIEEAKRSLQLGFYLLAGRDDPALSEHGEVCEAELWFPRSSAASWRRGFEMEHLDEVSAQLEQIGDRIEAEDWAPTYGPACGYCRVRVVCPLWPEGREAFAT